MHKSVMNFCTVIYMRCAESVMNFFPVIHMYFVSLCSSYSLKMKHCNANKLPNTKMYFNTSICICMLSYESHVSMKSPINQEFTTSWVRMCNIFQTFQLPRQCFTCSSNPSVAQSRIFSLSEVIAATSLKIFLEFLFVNFLITEPPKGHLCHCQRRISAS